MYRIFLLVFLMLVSICTALESRLGLLPFYGESSGTNVNFWHDHFPGNKKMLFLRTNYGKLNCWLRLRFTDDVGNPISKDRLDIMLDHSLEKQFVCLDDKQAEWVRVTDQADNEIVLDAGSNITIECKQQLKLADWEVIPRHKGQNKDSLSCQWFRFWRFWSLLLLISVPSGIIAAILSYSKLKEAGSADQTDCIAVKQDVLDSIEQVKSHDAAETPVMKALLRARLLQSIENPMPHVTWRPEFRGRDKVRKRAGLWSRAQNQFCDEIVNRLADKMS